MTPREAFNQSPQLATSSLPALPTVPGSIPAHPTQPGPPGAMPRPSSHTQLPRIARPPSIDGVSEMASPRSAPSSASPLSQNAQHGLPFMQQPPRSTSSPDPRLGADGPGSSRSSPVTSPRPAASIPPYAHMPTTGAGVGAQTNFAVPPPRVSSFTNAAALATGSGGSDGGVTPRRSETPTSTTSSHAPPGSGGPGAVQNYQPTQQPSARRSGSVTYCAKCGLAVRGQFVRALQQVYHLDCFRCRVSLRVGISLTPSGL